jgi:cobalamin synthase
MTNTNTPTGTNGSGKGSILKDSKIGAVAGGLVSTVLLYVADALGELDVSPLPDFLEPLAGGAILTATVWLVTKAAPRR